MGADQPDLPGRAEPDDLLLVGRVSARAAPWPEPGALGIEEAAREAVASLGLTRRPARRRGGARPRQRRPRPAGGLLPGLAGHAGGPAIGYGIRYEFGIFDQDIQDGWQVEATDKWLRRGNPWEIAQPGDRARRGSGAAPRATATSRAATASAGCRARRQGRRPTTRRSRATTAHCNILRLWSAEAAEAFDLEAFNTGEYSRAVDEKMSSENMTKVLYPNDEPSAASSCVWSSSTSSCPARCRTCCASSRATDDPRHDSPTSSRSSSTTPTRRSRSPS